MMIEWKVGKYKMQMHTTFSRKVVAKSLGGEGGKPAYERGGDARRLT